MFILNKKNRDALLRQLHRDNGKPISQPKVKPQVKPKESKESKLRDAPSRPQTKAEKEQADIDALSARFQQAEADKIENSYVDRQLVDLARDANIGCSTRILEGAVHVKGGKLAKAGRSKLLSRPSALPRSQSGSPALSGIGSPSLGPTSSNQAQEKAKKLRFPLIHELAVRDQSFGDLLPKWEGETEAEFHTQLEKVAHFDGGLQKWTLKQQCWKELDVYAYPYEKDEDRQKAIDNAIKKYDRLRLGVSDPLWQKLLPRAERGKGTCLSKVQAAIAKGSAPPAPRINVQPAEASSPSVDSEKEDSGSSSSKRPNVGGEPMARTNSGSKMKKVSEAQAQAKRLLSNKPSSAKAPSAKPTSKPSSAKTSPKVSPTKPTSKAATGKGGRVLSKEFISDSDTDSSEEAPLSSKNTTASKKAQELKDPKANLKVKPQPIERAVDRPKPVDKSRDVPTPKSKLASTKAAAAPKIMDSIRAEGVKPIRAPKRSREEDDDSSSSGTPLSKRLKNQDHVISKPQPSEPKHRKSDSSQNSRGSQSSNTSSAKVKASPAKSSPLASSPPTNASDMDVTEERDTNVTIKKRKFEPTRPEKSHSDRYERSDSSDSSISKRAKHDHGAKISKELREEAYRFKSYYARYESLHRELSALDNPPEDRLEQLLRMHRRLIDLKQQIKEGVGYTSQ